jgi:hypothetical protein
MRPAGQPHNISLSDQPAADTPSSYRGAMTMNQFKVTDDYDNERLKLLMKAVGNDDLEGESCPHCFEQYSIPILRKLKVPVLIPNIIKGEGEGVIDEALSSIRNFKERSVLRTYDNVDELVREYVCNWCNRSYLGELDLIANQAERRVLSFFGYDDSKMYERDFYTFSVLDDSYSEFVKELWDSSVKTTFDPHSMVSDAEDIITGAVLGQLRVFFVKFAKVVYENLGASVQVFTPSHANKLEKTTGADFAIWIGPLTAEDVTLLTSFRNGEIGFEELPVRVGNGAIFQAKKGNTGTIDKKQIDDLVHYASISYQGHDYFGIPGKLFMNYSPQPPFVTVLSCDYTYALYSGDLLNNRKTVSFPKTLKDLSEYATETELPEFVQAYLSGKAGTPLLMLRDVFGVDGPLLVVGLPPEMLHNPSTSGHSLSGILDGWCGALAESLQSVGTTTAVSKEKLQCMKQAFEEAIAEEEEAKQCVDREDSLRLMRVAGLAPPAKTRGPLAQAAYQQKLRREQAHGHEEKAEEQEEEALDDRVSYMD